MDRELDLWVGAKDYSDPETVRRVFKQAFDDSRRAYTEEKGFFNDKDFDQRRMKKRMETALKNLGYAREMIGEAYPDYPGTSYFEDDWSYLNSILQESYDTLDDEMDLLLGASLWILDTLQDAKKLWQTEADILPQLSEDEMYDVPGCLTVEDFTFSTLIIMKVKYVLLHRNDDCKVYSPKGEPHRTILDEATIRGKHMKDVPSRRTFEALLSALPEEAINEAVNDFRDKYWQLARIFFAGLRENHKERDEQMKRHDRLERKLNQYENKFTVRLGPENTNSLLTQDKSLRELKGQFDTITELDDGLGRCADAIAQGVEEKEQYALLFKNYPILPKKTQELFMSEEALSGIKTFHIDNPYRLCFALLYLADRGDDLIWMYYFGTVLAKITALALPWSVEYDELDSISQAEQKKDDPAPEPPLDLYSVMYESSEEDEYFRETLNPAQMMYEHTGVVLPRNIGRFDWLEQSLKQYDVPQEDRRVMRMCMTLMHAITHRYTGNYFETESQESAEPETETPSVPDYEKQIAAIRKENKSLNEQLWRSRRDHAAVSEKLEELIRTSKQEHEELSRLREVVFAAQNPEEDVPDHRIELPFEVSERVVVCGGHDSFIRQFSQMITGNVRILSNVRINEDLIKNAKMVWIQTNAISHSDYYKITDLCRKNDVPMYYFLNASARKCAEQIVEEYTKKEFKK
ncbi:MAG TPA: hypothetical protein DCG51_12950 [Erysipelotrichaceae bacterium]|nr:hypothetical protein [Erysipelotrichaceae bacterium]